MSTPMTLEQKNHAEWVAGLRAEYARRCTGAPAVTGCDTFAAQPGMGFDAFAAPPLHEMFDDALDLDFCLRSAPAAICRPASQSGWRRPGHTPR